MKSSEYHEAMAKDKKKVSHHPGITDEAADAGITTVGVQCLKQGSGTSRWEENRVSEPAASRLSNICRGVWY